MSRAVWTIVAPFCVVLAILAVVTIVRENTGSPAGAERADAADTAGVVSMEGLEFAPAEITVAKGGELVFDNDDVAPHTVTADDGSVDSGILDPGKAFKLTAQEGFAYHCEIHPSMKAQVRIEG